MQNNISSSRRRALIQAGGAIAGAAALGFPSLVLAQGKAIKIGFVSPQTGPLAPFGEADKFTIEQMNKLFAGGIDIGGKKVPVQIIQKDSQSNPNRAGEVANDLILKDKIDLMLVSSTPETANPVSDACELNEIPCISTVVPWQPWFFDWAFNLREPELVRVWARIPNDTNILVLHGPPHGFGDAVPRRNGEIENTGSPSLTERIRAIQPQVVVFGHIHEGRGEYRLGKSVLANVTSVDVQYRNVYKPWVHELPTGS